MSLVAPRLDRIKPSPTIATSIRASELKAAGRDVVGLGYGEPDFNTPEHIKEAAIEALRSDQTKYTPVNGVVPLRQAICRKFKRENGVEYKIDQIAVGCGSKQLLYNALVATFAPDDEVIIPAPYWVSYPDMTLLCDGIPVFVDCFAKDGFKLQPEALERAITTKTKWLLLIRPTIRLVQFTLEVSYERLRMFCFVIHMYGS